MGLWTKEEIAILKKYYPTECSKVRERLPGRSIEAIHSAARVHGVKALRLHFNRLWTQEETDIVIKYYPTEGPKVVERLTGRTLHAVHRRVAVLNHSRTDEDKIRQLCPKR